jgi:hypothetical protein
MAIEFYILAILGVCSKFLFSVINRKNKKIPFSISYLLTDSPNGIRFSVSMILVIFVLSISDDIANITNITLSGNPLSKKIIVFFFGYSIHSLIRLLTKNLTNLLNK